MGRRMKTDCVHSSSTLIPTPPHKRYAVYSVAFSHQLYEKFGSYNNTIWTWCFSLSRFHQRSSDLVFQWWWFSFLDVSLSVFLINSVQCLAIFFPSLTSVLIIGIYLMVFHLCEKHAKNNENLCRFVKGFFPNYCWSLFSCTQCIINRSCLFGASAKEVMFSSVLLCLSLC